MLVSGAITAADKARPNGMDAADKLTALSNFEGRIQVEIMGRSIDGLVSYGSDDTGEEMLIKEPYAEIYVLYLCVVADIENADYISYGYDCERFNRLLSRIKSMAATETESVFGSGSQIKGGCAKIKNIW